MRRAGPFLCPPVRREKGAGGKIKSLPPLFAAAALCQASRKASAGPWRASAGAMRCDTACPGRAEAAPRQGEGEVRQPDPTVAPWWCRLLALLSLPAAAEGEKAQQVQQVQQALARRLARSAVAMAYFGERWGCSPAATPIITRRTRGGAGREARGAVPVVPVVPAPRDKSDKGCGLQPLAHPALAASS